MCRNFKLSRWISYGIKLQRSAFFYSSDCGSMRNSGHCHSSVFLQHRLGLRRPPRLATRLSRYLCRSSTVFNEVVQKETKQKKWACAQVHDPDKCFLLRQELTSPCRMVGHHDQAKTIDEEHWSVDLLALVERVKVSPPADLDPQMELFYAVILVEKRGGQLERCMASGCFEWTTPLATEMRQKKGNEL